jgi:hypothetical protein
MAEKSPNQQLVALATQESLLTTSVSNWQAPFIRYLSSGTGYSDKIENECLLCCSKHYLLVDGTLMHKNAKEEILIKCISQDDGIKLLDEIHGGTCGNNAASRTLVEKAF